MSLLMMTSKSQMNHSLQAYLCPAGHSFCRPWLVLLDGQAQDSGQRAKCHVCQVEFPDMPARNRPLERLLVEGHLPIKCPVGCGHEAKKADLERQVTSLLEARFTKVKSDVEVAACIMSPDTGRTCKVKKLMRSVFQILICPCRTSRLRAVPAAAAPLEPPLRRHPELQPGVRRVRRPVRLAARPLARP